MGIHFGCIRKVTDTRRVGTIICQASWSSSLYTPSLLILSCFYAGSRHIPRFRSPEEFLLHLKWLMHGQLLKPGNKRDCGCQYCDPIVSQGDINRRLGLGNVSSKAGDSDDSEEERKKKFGKEKKKERRGNSSFDIPFKDYRKLPPPSNT